MSAHTKSVVLAALATAHAAATPPVGPELSTVTGRRMMYSGVMMPPFDCITNSGCV
ncbi:hypothetical protein D3C83_200680 [compost metagenome]